jgi:ribosomal protein L29
MAEESAGSETEGTEEEVSAEPVEIAPEPVEEMMADTQETSSGAPSAAQEAGGRRTQFRIVRESIQALSVEVGRYRKSHEASAKKLEAQVTSLRKDLATHIHSKDLGVHVKSHEAGNKRLEKQIASLRGELASLKGQMAKEAAKSRAKQEATLSRILAKVKTAKPKSKAKASRKKR